MLHPYILDPFMLGGAFPFRSNNRYKVIIGLIIVIGLIRKCEDPSHFYVIYVLIYGIGSFALINIKTMNSQAPFVIGVLQVNHLLYNLVKEVIAPATGVAVESFWKSLESILHDLMPKNRELLAKRDEIQAKIDDYHVTNRGRAWDMTAYKTFLKEIGYLLPEGGNFNITTANVDPEIAKVAGPQLVVPVNNSRYALNAANARWGSLFDALYGTNAITDDGGAERRKEFNPTRAKKVFGFVDRFLDEVAPLREVKWSSVTGISVPEGKFTVTVGEGQSTGLSTPGQFIGYTLTSSQLTSILLHHHGLHIEILLDIHGSNPVAQLHPAKIKDVVLESAITTIMDCEDSVSAVDACDKVTVYKVWTGLMKGDVSAQFEKGGKVVVRSLNKDRTYLTPDGGTLTLAGRSLLLVRNVGLHMYTDIVTYNNHPIPEGILDAMVTVLASFHDLKKHGDGLTNSRTGSIYIVKPKMHGPEEVAFSVDLFDRVEKALGLARNTIKIGIMDEERRTTVNLKECIRSASERVVFINTGFLDRTGDEIHTSMEAGIFQTKAGIKEREWLQAYEDWNMDIGLECGLNGRAQIGKGMWAAPDCMREMLAQKISHPMSGANTAWVPSPTAATLHAMHYHQIDVHERQSILRGRSRANLDHILTPPLCINPLRPQDIETDLMNDVQGILGYVVRWVDQGIGCSKVPDIHNIGLMEDRATLRISSQHLANWLLHNVITPAHLIATFEKMAAIVDQQNAGDPSYMPMTGHFEKSVAYQAALDLVLKGGKSANGYTEDVLTNRRKEFKTKHAFL